MKSKKPIDISPTSIIDQARHMAYTFLSSDEHGAPWEPFDGGRHSREYAAKKSATVVALKIINSTTPPTYTNLLLSPHEDDKWAQWHYWCALSAKIIELGHPLPPPLAEHVARYLREEIKKPSPKGAGKLNSRNMAYAFCVAAIVHRYDLNPTRNEASDTLSACDIVANAANSLTNQSKFVTYDTVQKCWQKDKEMANIFVDAAIDTWGSLENLAAMLEKKEPL